MEFLGMELVPSRGATSSVATTSLPMKSLDLKKRLFDFFFFFFRFGNELFDGMIEIGIGSAQDFNSNRSKF